MPNIKEVTIIGSGPAGYTAAIYSARANLNPTLISGLQPGGQLTITTDVENYPGYENPIQGPWLMEQMQKQAQLVGTEILNTQVNKVELNDSLKKIFLDDGSIIESKTVIISTGAQARWLGLENEEKFQGHGLSACATCDGFFFKDRKVAVIGGGNSAAEEALFLTKFASEVFLIHRRDQLRAEKILQDRLKNNSKIKFIWNRVIIFTNYVRKDGFFILFKNARIFSLQIINCHKVSISSIWILRSYAESSIILIKNIFIIYFRI